MTDRTTPAIADIDRCIATIENSTKRWSGNADYRRFLETELFCLREVRKRLAASAQGASEYEAHLRAINDLVTLSEEDYCSDDTEEGEWREPDDEPVAAGENSVSAITFGDVRRAREAIDALMAAARTPAASDGQ